MATVCLVPEDQEDIATGNLLGAQSKVDIETGDLLGAESIVDITVGGLVPSLATSGLTPLGVCT